MNWQWLRHAVVSAMLCQSLSSFCQPRRNFDDGRPSVEEHPRWHVNRVQIRAIRWTKCLAQWTEGSHACKFLCFWRCEREHSPAAVTIYNGHISPWCRVASLCQAPRHMVLSAWLNKNDFCIAHVQHCDGHRSTAAGIFALALPDFWRWCFSWEQLMSKCGHSYIIN